MCVRERVTAQRRVCVRQRERESHSVASCVCKHIRASSLCRSRDCSSFKLELMVKLRTLLTVFTFILKAKARDYGKGRYISGAACGVRPIIRADCACQKEGLVGNKAFERGGA